MVVGIFVFLVIILFAYIHLYNTSGIQREKQEDDRKRNDLLCTMMVLEDMVLDGKDRDRRGYHSSRFINFAYHAHTLLYRNPVSRQTILKRLLKMDYKTAIYKKPLYVTKNKGKK